MFAQIAIPPSGAIENWLLSAAAIASMALLVKKLFFRTPGNAEFVTQTDLHREMTSLRPFGAQSRHRSCGHQAELLVGTVHSYRSRRW